MVVTVVLVLVSGLVVVIVVAVVEVVVSGLVVVTVVPVVLVVLSEKGDHPDDSFAHFRRHLELDRAMKQGKCANVIICVSLIKKQNYCV